MKQLDRQILHIAVPSIVSNVTVPLLGLVDTAITGHLGAAAYLAAIAVGTSIFSVCYWVFSFLRMGTGGLTAQAFGRQSWSGCEECLRKALTIAITAGLAIIALQTFIADFALWLMDTRGDVEQYARTYFYVLVWGAPANLALSAMNGWFIGMQDAKSPMIIAVGQNVLNIVVSSFLVIVLGWKVEGVATGTLVAQWAGCIAATYLVAKRIHARNLGTLTTFATPEDAASSIAPTAQTSSLPIAEGGERGSWSRFFSVNRDIFLRTVCLVAVMFSFTAFGSRQGDITLAVNALLMQMFMLVSYIMDGFAYAGEALGGSLMGAGDKNGFELLKRRLFVWGGATALLFCLMFAVGSDGFVWLLTDNETVRESAGPYLWATIVIPLVSLGAFIYDGLFIGTTSTREMLISIFVATVAYFAIALSTTGNAWLWVAFLAYLGLRGLVQHALMPRILARHFS